MKRRDVTRQPAPAKVLQFRRRHVPTPVPPGPRCATRRLANGDVELKLSQDGQPLVTAVLHRDAAAHALLLSHLLDFARESRDHDAPLDGGGRVLAFPR